jgi:hypothetical protein
VRLGGCCIPKLTAVVWSFLGPDYWDRDFGDGLLMTGCFARIRSEPAGRRLYRGWTEDGTRFDGREGGRMLHSKVDCCCMELFGTKLLGQGFWGRFFYDGLLSTDLN